MDPRENKPKLEEFSDLEPKHLIVPIYHRHKNPEWFNETPNERYDSDREYFDFINKFRAIHKIFVPNIWKEVIITKGVSDHDIPAEYRWWDSSMFIDKIFWVWKKPIKELSKDKAPVFIYMLEPCEVSRVMHCYWEKMHRLPRGWDFRETRALGIPTDCCMECYDDMRGGYSEHIRPRTEIKPTQLEVDKDMQRAKEAHKKWDDIVAIEEAPDGKWINADKKKREL